MSALGGRGEMKKRQGAAMPSPPVSSRKTVKGMKGGRLLKDKFRLSKRAEVTRIVFLGTSSGICTKSRNTSSVAVSLSNGRTLLFDCGEGTHRQILSTKKVKLSKIRYIFITHLHGDHVYGIFGVLTALDIGNNSQSSSRLVVIGPKGIKQLLQSVASASASSMLLGIRIIELPRLPASPETKSAKTHIAIDVSSRHEPEFGHDVFLNGVDIHLEDGIVVKARRIKHVKQLETWGYIIWEPDKPGKLKLTVAKEMGASDPELALLKSGNDLMDSNGEVRIRAKDVLTPSQKGMHIAMLWDTYDASNAAEACMDCSLMVHEATYLRDIKENALKYGHSTAEMVGNFASKVRARQLVLTHISARYQNEIDLKRLVEEAQIVGGFHEEKVLRGDEDKSSKFAMAPWTPFFGDEALCSCGVKPAEDIPRVLVAYDFMELQRTANGFREVSQAN